MISTNAINGRTNPPELSDTPWSRWMIKSLRSFINLDLDFGVSLKKCRSFPTKQTRIGFVSISKSPSNSSSWDRILAWHIPKNGRYEDTVCRDARHRHALPHGPPRPARDTPPSHRTDSNVCFHLIYNTNHPFLDHHVCMFIQHKIQNIVRIKT